MLKKIIKDIKYDIDSIKKRDPAAKSSLEVLFLYPGVHAVMSHRVSHWLYKNNMFLLARTNSQFTRFLTGIEIHPGAKIGKGLFIDHGMGVVIGETAEIGDECTIYQNVTLGGTGKDKGKRHPTLGNNVMVGCGAKVLGPFKVGDNTKIAAGAVVLAPVGENSTAVGVPAKVVTQNGEKVKYDLDQVHIPDPVAQQLNKILDRLEVLEKRLEEIKK
jgi:serine O-acetyltransferase